MTSTDQITHLLDHGVLSLTVGRAPNRTDLRTMLFVQATQAVKTGPGGTHIQLTHQVEDASLAECLNQVAKQVEHANSIKTSLVELPKGGRG